MIGEFHHSLDVKGRVNFPAKLREELGERFYITKGLDGCLFVYSEAEWDKLAQRIRNQPISKKRRELQRFFFGSAVEAEPDKQGRVNIPGPLRDFAGLDKEVVVVGSMDWAEIWDKARWKAQEAELEEETIAGNLDDFDF
ncbi:division/cell wall cluster transcriptional repressor MraZ [Ruminococcaceae bacterium OttesenSCG-928-L11]|nr:division/cell wall cluster transcriptional repressor MraZ [Ruminococcaceae bacterium OttesenSCG-928-L11]